MNCDLIFILDDGSEIIGKDSIDKVLHLFPLAILEKVRPIFLDAGRKAKDWNKSIVKVYQNGRIETKCNIPPDLPFNVDFE